MAALASLRSGAWITPARLRMVGRLLAIAYAGTIVFLLSGAGMFDPLGRPIGSDFAAFYGASRALLRGVPAATLYDPDVFNREIMGFTGTSHYVWIYPPTAFVPYWWLGLLPYLWALAAWLLIGVATYVVTIRAIVPARMAELAAVLSPAVFVTVVHGQNGLLLGIFIGGGLVLLPRAPFLAGCLFGLTCVKPHLGLLLPVALIASRRWRALAGVATAAGMLAVVATAAFGLDVWQAFERSSAVARYMLETEGVSYTKIGSVFAAARLLGASIEVGFVLQGLATSGAVWLVYLVWRRRYPYDVQAATLVVAGLLATPYLYDYDLPVLGVALAFWARHAVATEWRPWERTALFTAWATPLVMRAVAVMTHVSALPLVLTATVLLLLTRAVSYGEPAPSAGSADISSTPATRMGGAGIEPATPGL